MAGRRLLWAVLLLTAGCVNVNDPVPIGKDTYMVTLGAMGGLSTTNGLLTQSIKKAGEFCASKGQNVMVQNTQTSGVQGFTPMTNQVVFQCLSSDDPAYNRSKIEQSSRL